MIQYSKKFSRIRNLFRFSYVLLAEVLLTNKGLSMKLSAEDAFRLYGDRVFSAAFSVTGNQADADDAVQDTYLRYCSYDKEFTDEDHIRAWLLRVAINRARDQKRSFWEKHRVS